MIVFVCDVLSRYTNHGWKWFTETLRNALKYEQKLTVSSELFR